MVKRAIAILGALLLVLMLGGAGVLYLAMGMPVMGSNWVLPGANMEPTLRPGERVIADPRVAPVAGSIVVFSSAGGSGMRVDRVIAVGGQTVDLSGGAVLVDGVKVDEPYVHGQPTEALDPNMRFPIKLASGMFWLMGDNRPNSGDSRIFGPVRASSVRGVVTRVYWPLSAFRVIPTSR